MLKSRKLLGSIIEKVSNQNKERTKESPCVTQCWSRTFELVYGTVKSLKYLRKKKQKLSSALKTDSSQLADCLKTVWLSNELLALV